ncbi:hypothetical protein [Parendozoicomonas sp. Alg238-R29]|nr:hypothetical protein [Parendozoicomonas sp. Alg238-R29]
MIRTITTLLAICLASLLLTTHVSAVPLPKGDYLKYCSGCSIDSNTQGMI